MESTTQNIAKKIAKDFDLPYDHFLKESSRLFLEKKLKTIVADILEIATRYGVSSTSEFENLYIKGKIDESSSLVDFKQLDRLEYKKEKIQKLLEQIETE